MQLKLGARVALTVFAMMAPVLPRALVAQTPPPRPVVQRDTSRLPDSSRRVVVPRPPADSTDSTKRAGLLQGVPGMQQLPFQLNIRTEAKSERFQNLRCSSADQTQISVISGCSTSFLAPAIDAKWSLKASGLVGERFNVNIDYDAQREFDASNVFSLQYVGKPGEHVQRFDVGNIAFAPPPSRFVTSALPSGNFGAQGLFQFGSLKLKTIFAQQTGNVVQNRLYTIAARAEQHTTREIEDYQIERLRFFFTVDPALLGGGRAYPNIDILNRAQMSSLLASLPDTLRPTRVVLYRLQFGAQPQNANGPRLAILGDSGGGRQTYDVLREGVDYYLDQSNLWFALVRPLNEQSERLLVAYNVRINGKDTVWTTTGGTPDITALPREQFANRVMDPSVGPSSPAFRREIRSVYRVAGEDLVRGKTRVRIVTGGGLLEHPLAGSDPTFLQMFGLARSTNPAEFDYDNRLWPRVSDPIFNLGAGAADVRNNASLDPSRIIRDYFLVFPSVRPFAERVASGGLVVPGNPSNEAIYTTAGEYLYSPQHPSSLYRIHLEYESNGPDETGALTLGATQMRPGSERVVVDGRPVTRDLDYTIDYDLGRIEFTRTDTLFREQRRVEVRFEENPVFSPTPTTLAGFVTELPVRNGVLNFTAINQSQSTSATRPLLGFQGSSSLMTGISGQFSWAAPGLTSFVNWLPFRQTTAPSRISVQGEIATSHPQFLARKQGAAWVDQFEGGGGIAIPLGDAAWQYASLPAYGKTLHNLPGFPSLLFETERASTLVWQTNGRTAGGGNAIFTQRMIDPLTTLFGTGLEPNEPVLWLTLLPLSQAGRYKPDARRFDWTVGGTLTGPRFRSIRATLSPSGIDLSRGQFLEFWALVDTSASGRQANPTLVFDFGDISENSLTFAPETLTVQRTNGVVDSLFTGKKPKGVDRIDSERDSYSHAFNFEVNDKGLPGDIADTLVVKDGTSVRRELNVPTCKYALGTVEFLGNPRANCTVDNSRLDEEDIDLDNTLNLNSSQRENERLLRYVINLSDPKRYRRVGGTYQDSLVVGGALHVRTRQWVLVSVPFDTPDDSLNDVNRRRMRAVRLTVVSGVGQPDNEAVQFPIANIRVTGAPWLNRANTSLNGIAGARPAGGFVITSSIGTNDSSTTLVYQPPPGVGDEPEFRGTGAGRIQTAINEHSMRIQASIPAEFGRTESFLRFPGGPQDYLVSKRLRMWGRGRGNGWGQNGELEMFLKVGRDENNFYLYRSPLESGSTQAAWTDLSIDLSRFIALRKQVQADYLAGKQGSIACTGVDSAIIAASPVPAGTTTKRFAACDNGYMVYTLDPAVTAPNLGAVQELSAGIIRVGVGGGASPIIPGDTLELWIDDVRLEEPQNAMGVAGQFSVELNAADLGDLRMTFSNKDPNFRQVGEQPTFLGERNLDIAGTLHLERMLPGQWANSVALPLTINKLSLANDPLYLSHTDIAGQGMPGLRKPKTDLTTYSLSVRRATPTEGLLGPLLNNLALTSTYTSGVNRTEYQDGKTRNFSVTLDYLVVNDTGRVVSFPLFGGLRWNPTQFRLNSGIVRGDDRRASFIKPANAVDDQPAVSQALSRLWRTGSTFEFRPANSLTARWELQSVRDLRDYGDTSALAAIATRERRRWFGANAGFERERTLFTNLSWTPALWSWLLPRAELGTQYEMLRDPNARSLVPLPGVVVVDSILAARDSLAAASSLTMARRMTIAQTASVGTQIDIARALTSRDSTSSLRRMSGVLAPIDVSYTRSLLSALDAAAMSAPLSLQFGFGGPANFRTVGGVPASASGQTGLFAAAGTLRLPFGTSFVNRFSRTMTANWIARPDGGQSQVDGSQRQFPDVALRWSYRPAMPSTVVTNFDASAGYVRTNARVTLPSLAADAPPDLRRSAVESFPITGSIVLGGRRGLSTSAKYSVRRSVDSLPGSIARSFGTDVGLDAGHAFHIPTGWQLGIRDDLRTRFSFQQSHNTTSVLDSAGLVRARLQDNGRTAFTFTADANVNEFVVFTANGSHIITFDNNLNRRFAYTVFSAVFQVQFYGGK